MTEQTEIQLKPGLWYERGGGVATVRGRISMENYPWDGESSTGEYSTWTHTGRYYCHPQQTDRDLIAPVVTVPDIHGWIPVDPALGGRLPTDEDEKACGDKFAITWRSGLVCRGFTAAQVRDASNNDIIAWVPDPIPEPFVPPPPKPSTEIPDMQQRICNLCGNDDSDCVCIDGETAALYRRHLLSQLESAKHLVREIENTLEKLNEETRPMSDHTHKQSEWEYLGWTDEDLMRVACQEEGCGNFADQGSVYCIIHLHGTPDPMPEEMRKRKLFLEKGDDHD